MDGAIHGIHEPAGLDPVPERDTAHGQEHNGPRKLLKVVLRMGKPVSATTSRPLARAIPFLEHQSQRKQQWVLLQ